MNDITFTQNEIDLLHKMRFEHPMPLVQKRCEALFLKSQGLTHSEICQLLRTSMSSVTRWVRAYSQSGIEGLTNLQYGKRKSSLAPFSESIENYFIKNPPNSIKEAVAKIKELTGIERSEKSVRVFLRSLGFSYRKTGRVPGKANKEAQEEFKKKAWNQS
jgi:transposase